MTDDDTKRAIEAAKDLLDLVDRDVLGPATWLAERDALRTALSALDRPKPICEDCSSSGLELRWDVRHEPEDCPRLALDPEQGHESYCALLTDPERGECDCRPVSNSAEELAKKIYQVVLKRVLSRPVRNAAEVEAQHSWLTSQIAQALVAFAAAGVRERDAELKRLKDQVDSAYTDVCPYCGKPVGGTMKGRLENPYCSACLTERMDAAVAERSER